MPFTGGSGLRKATLSSALLAVGFVLHLPAAETFIATRADTTQSDPTAPITVGPRAAVGTETAGRKAAEGIVGGVVSSVFGRRNHGSQSDRPDTRRDPTRKLDYVEIKAMDGALETAARARWTDDGLLVSVRIADAPGKGTFQAVFLRTCNAELYPGRDLLRPARYEIYDLWDEGSFSVGWSSGTVRDGEVVAQDSGSFGGGWDDGVGHDEAMTGPGTWRQLGFDKAHHGARQIGAYFDISPVDLAQLGETHLFVHTTLPAQDPVTTAASYWAVISGADGDVALQLPQSHPDGWWGHCHSTPPSSLIASAATTPQRHSDSVWDDLQLVGVEAKIFSSDP